MNILEKWKKHTNCDLCENGSLNIVANLAVSQVSESTATLHMEWGLTMTDKQIRDDR